MRYFKHIFARSFVLMMIFSIFFSQFNFVNAQAPEIGAESAILVNAETGEILYAKNADLKLPPASMTKMMTEYLILEAIDEGLIGWEDTTQISDYAYGISANNAFSGIGLRQNKNYTVRELYEAMAIISDNATTIALAELVAGSEGEFVKQMNAKGEELGLTNFEFVNSTGLPNSSLGDNYPEGTDPDGDNLISARSTALLAYHLINDYPEVLSFSSMLRSELDGEQLENLNWMLPWNNTNFAPYYFEGMEGLKTGYTDVAGYCFTGTSVRDGQRLISVVMRSDSNESRFLETAQLLNYGYNEFVPTNLFAAGYQLPDHETIEVAKGKDDEVGIELADQISSLVRIGEENAYSIEYVLDEDLLDDQGRLVAPIDEGTKVGEAHLTYDGNADYGNILADEDNQKVDLITTASVEKDNWFMLTISAIGDFFSQIFSSIAETVKGWF